MRDVATESPAISFPDRVPEKERVFVDFVAGAADHVGRGEHSIHRTGTVPGAGEAEGRQRGGVWQGAIRVFRGRHNAAGAPREPAVTNTRRAISWTPGRHERGRQRSRSAAAPALPPAQRRGRLLEKTRGRWRRRQVQRVHGGKGVCGRFRDTHRCGSLRRHGGGPCRATDPQRGLQPDLRWTERKDVENPPGSPRPSFCLRVKPLFP
jgi:hypothetical protein